MTDLGIDLVEYLNKLLMESDADLCCQRSKSVPISPKQKCTTLQWDPTRFLP